MSDAKQTREAKKNADLLRKLQNKLRKQRQDLQRTHEYDSKQKLKEQSLWYETEIKSLNKALDQELSLQKQRYETELQEVQYVIIIYIYIIMYVTIIVCLYIVNKRRINNKI